MNKKFSAGTPTVEWKKEAFWTKKSPLTGGGDLLTEMSFFRIQMLEFGAGPKHQNI